MHTIPKILIKIVSVIFAFLFVLYLAVLALFPRNFNIDKFKTRIEKEIQKQTGLTAGIENITVKTSLSPNINIHANHIIFLYPNKKELLKIKDLDIKVKVLPIVFRKIQIDKITVNRPILNFSVNKDGSCSLDEYLTKKYTPDGTFSGFKFSEKIPDIQLNRYKIKIYDSKYRNPFTAEGDELKIEQSKTGGIKTFIKGILKYNEQPYITYDTEIDTTFPEIKKRLFESNPFDFIRKYDVKGNISSKITLKQEQNKKIKANGTASINKLSFVLDNKRLENNFINLKIADNKLTVDADLKTGLKDKIKVTGTATTGENPNLNLKCIANHINLRTLSETLSTILNTLNIRNEITNYIFDGNANFDFKIKGNKKSIQSQGYAEIFDASVDGKDIPYKINGINSKINLDNNTIKIEPSKMLINGTAITFCGEIDKKTNMNLVAKGENLSAERLSKLFLPKDFTKNKDFFGVLSFNSDIKGNFKEPKITVSTDLKNFTFKNNSKRIISFYSGKLNLSGNLYEPEGKIELFDANILSDDFQNNLKIKKLIINLSKNILDIPETKLNFGGSPMNLSGKISDIKTQTPSYKIHFDGGIKSSALYSVIKKNAAFKDFMAAPKGEIITKGIISGKGSNASLTAEFDANKDNYLSGFVIKELLNMPSKTIVEASLKDDEIVIKDFSVNKTLGKDIVEKIITVNGKISNFKAPVLQGVKIIIPKAMTFSVDKLKNSEITVKSDLTINGNAKEPQIQGSLDIKNVIIPEYKLKSVTNNIVFDKNIIKLTIPKLEIGQSNFDISANINSFVSQPVILKDLILKADTIDLDELNDTFSDISNDPVYPGIKVPVIAQSGKAFVKTFRTGGLQAENVSFDVSLINNVMKMTNITGNAYGGSLSGSAEYNFLQTATKSEITGKSADIRRLIEALTGKSDEMTGLIDYKVKVNAIGTKKTQQLRTAKGFAEFTATKGVMGTLGQFEHFLYAQNLISQSILKTTVLNVVKAIKPQNTGIYTVSSGKIEISGGNAYLKPLTVEGPNMSLYITGKLNILNDLADLKIYGRVSQEVEKLLGDLSNPVPATIMSRSSETSIGNLFYDEYNTTVSKAITDAIPNLNPNTGTSSRPFMVVIQGAPESIKAVKSFKWIVSATLAPVPNIHKEELHGDSDLEHKEPKEETKRTLPSFLDILPDEFN